MTIFDRYANYRLLARSRTPLIQAARALPARSAAAAYRAFLSGDRRISSRSVSPLSRGGLPRGRLGGCFMASIMPVQIIVDKS